LSGVRWKLPSAQVPLLTLFYKGYSDSNKMLTKRLIITSRGSNKHYPVATLLTSRFSTAGKVFFVASWILVMPNADI
jgi:hypothetical protein